MTQKAYPLDNTEYYAEDVRLFHVARTSGIFNATGNDLQVTAAGGMKLNVSPGYAFLLTAKDGVGGITYGSNAKETLNAEVPEKEDRYDYVSVRYDKVSNTCALAYTKGTTTQPEPVRNANSYEIILAVVTIRKNATDIRASDITDTRLNGDVCGLVIDGTERIPTDGMYTEFTDFMTESRELYTEVSKGIAPLTNAEIDEATT